MSLLWVILAVLVLAGGAILVFNSRGGSKEIDPSTIFLVSKEDLTISVVESGQLKAADSVDIYCEMRGSTSILEIIDEGKWVEPGELLVRLDSSNLEDDLVAQRITFENANAAKVQAEKAVEIQASTNESKIRSAQLALDNATDELDKWMNGGRTVEEQRLIEDLTLAKSEAARAELEMINTKQLVDRNFAAQTELDADKLDVQRATVRVAQLEREQLLSDSYDWKIQERVLKAAVDEAEAELARARSEAEADLAREQANYNSKLATYNLEEGKLELLEDQRGKAEIFSEVEGLVVYPTNSGGRRGGSDRDRIEQGIAVRERQLLISIPDTSKMIAAISVHETAIDKVEVGQPAVINVDAKAQGTYFGKVSFVAPLPDSANAWLNPDLKVYRVEIALEEIKSGAEKLRPGMSVSCEVMVDKLEDALAIPVHAVHKEGSHLFCYVDRNNEVQIQEVEIGLSNDSRVAITSGLNEGDRVYLAVPSGAPKPEFGEVDEEAAGYDIDAARARASEIVVEPPPRDQGAGGEGRRGAGRGEGGGRPGAGGPGGAPGGPGGQMTDEQKKAMERFQNASDEEKKKMMEEFRKKAGGGGGAER